jgi:ribonucleoside-diphosphate reductase alpha chain
LLDNVITITCNQIREEEKSILSLSGDTEELKIIRTRKFSNWACSFKKILHSMESERSIGMGVMGWHSYLQKNNINFCSNEANQKTEEIFSAIKKASDKNNKLLAVEKGSCLDDPNVRHMYTMAIAPTASISSIMDTSASIRPNIANIVKDISPAGEIVVKNKYLDALLKEITSSDLKEDTIDMEAYNALWRTISLNAGNIDKGNPLFTEHADTLSIFDNPFQNASEFNKAIIEQAIIRQKYIDQAQSLDFFYSVWNDGVDGCFMKQSALKNIFSAWKGGLKTIYYHYSSNSHKANRIQEQVDNAECLGCS